MLEANNSVINLDGKVSPAVLAGIFGCNVSLVYQESQNSRLPTVLTEATYRECIQMYVNYFKKNQDLKILKEENDHALKMEKLKEKMEMDAERRRLKEEEQAKKDRERAASGKLPVSSDDVVALTVQKMKQDIRLGIGKEAQTWMKIAIERKDYLSVKELTPLCEPFLLAIKNMLVDIAADASPEQQRKIDQGMDSLYQLGMTLMERAEVDSQNFVKQMLDRDIEVGEIDTVYEENPLSSLGV